MNEKLKKIIEDTNYIRKEVKDVFENGAKYRWINKEVSKEEVLFKPSVENMGLVSEPNYAKISYAKYDNKDTLLLEANNDIEALNIRPACSFNIKLDSVDLTEFNRIKTWIYLDIKGQENMYVHFYVGNDSDAGKAHTESVYANKWNEVVWEINDTLRDNVNSIKIVPFLFGCPPEGEGDLKLYISDIYAQKVEADRELGFDIEEDIAYCHSGYFRKADKIALTQSQEAKTFKVVEKKTNKVYEFDSIEIDTINGKFCKLDFSSIKKSGEYYIEYNNKKTNSFLINDNPYFESILKSMNFLRSLRCGEDIPGVHSACHLNCRSVDENGRTVPVFGGWHDAGDLSQFEICTAEMTHALADLATNVNDEKLKERIMEEAKVGANWLLRTTFHDGNRALAILYRIWRDNLLHPDNKLVNAGVAENGPFENFLSAAALASCVELFKEEDKNFSEWCLRIAKEDFHYAVLGYKNGIYTKRWGPNIDSVVCGHGIVAACLLYKLTKEESYLEIAKEYANIVMKCQQSTYPKWDKPVRGFFYEDVKHKYILTYEHRGHEQSPIQGICDLYELLKDNKEEEKLVKKLLKSIKLFKEFIVDTMYSTEPYGLLPGHIYIEDKLNLDRFTLASIKNDYVLGKELLCKQIEKGIKLADGVYLRRFPIAIQRRGFHATMLSKAKGVSMVANALNDKKLKQIVIDQFEWVLGKNPFASSTMYGEGYNYHPLYVAFSRQMVGALPVGIMTSGDEDLPYWPTRNNAVYKEIWGHTTGKYLWALSDVLKEKK